MIIIGLDPSLTAFGVSDGETHRVIHTHPLDRQTQAQNLIRRCDEICGGIDSFIAGREAIAYLEGPSYGSGAGHLFEAGWLYGRLYYWLDYLQIREVSPGSWRKALFGNGSISKERIVLAAYKKFGLEIAGDRGCNMLEAALLCEYGRRVEDGVIEFKPAALRGQKRRKAA